ncbi:transposase family protein [Patescibacteria group bacterium]|nr:transposase family protein [Patescibacteria group bacterium]
MFNPSQFESIDQIETFLSAADVFSLDYTMSQKEKAQWLRDRLLHFHYRDLPRLKQGRLRKFFSIITGYSSAQLSRHIHTYQNGEPVCKKQKRHSFPIKYTPKDVELLVETDNLHGRINGTATTKIMQEEFARGDMRYERLKNISTSRLYDLRSAVRYRERSTTYEKTQSVQTPIGERRKPRPKGKPGFIRTDSVHQGDRDGKKGVYHINNVDEVTQWEIPVAVENLQETCVEPALDEAFEQFPFFIKNFHSDNGGEYINDVVQQFLKRWKAKQTKSRPYRSNDNGLAETKNGAIIRKHMTHHHIPQPYASRINKFYREHLIPYINFHRPCAFPKVEVLKNGKKKITYPKENYMTPYEKLKSLPSWEQYLRPGITPEMLEKQAKAKTPNQAAGDMKKAKEKLLNIVIPPHDVML